MALRSCSKELITELAAVMRSAAALTAAVALSVWIALARAVIFAGS
jgi:hypothetical protein